MRVLIIFTSPLKAVIVQVWRRGRSKGGGGGEGGGGGGCSEGSEKRREEK